MAAIPVWLRICCVLEYPARHQQAGEHNGSARPISDADRKAAAQLMELTILAPFRDARDWNISPIRTLFLLVQRPACSMPAPPPSFWGAGSRTLLIAILKGVHLFLNHVGDFLNRAANSSGGPYSYRSVTADFSAMRP